jgi:hypothetical protein
MEDERCTDCYDCLSRPELGLDNPVLYRMVTCIKCGNKRCPHATSHKLECTNSNEPNQPGSRY